FTSCTAAQDDRNAYYWNNGERVGVVVAPSSVALRFSVEPSADLIASIAREQGLEPSPNQLYASLRRDRVVVYAVPGGAQVDNRYVAGLQDRLRRSGAPVADVARVVTNARGAVASMPQTLSVGFIDGISGLEDLRGLDDVVVRSISVVRILNDQPRVISYRVNSDSDRTALEIANAVYEYRDNSGRRLVTYAVPTLRFPGELRTIPNQPQHPDDDLYSGQWHLNSASKADVDAPEAWDYTRGAVSGPAATGCGAAERIRIAVLDDGVDTGHPDLIQNISPGKDYTTLTPGPNANPTDVNDRHGTQVAGVIAACGNNGIGVSGICQLCEIVPIKINPSNVDENVAALYDSKSVFGADLVSNSWGRELTDDLRMALDVITGANSGGSGIPVFFAVSNVVTADDCATDISGAESVIAISGSSAADLAGSVASSGNCVDLVAPTASNDDFDGLIVTTDLRTTGAEAESEYTAGFGGTSSATALAAGIAGLVLSLNPDLTAEDVRNILKHTAEKIGTVGTGYNAEGFSPKAGYGRVNAHRAVVPVVKISGPDTPVQVNQPFTIKVSASAPYRLSAIGWTATVRGCSHSTVEWRAVAAAAFKEELWSVSLSKPGKYVFTPDARDALFPLVDAYPHAASKAFPVLPEVVLT